MNLTLRCGRFKLRNELKVVAVAMTFLVYELREEWL